MEKHVVLNNVINGNFIIPIDLLKDHDPKTNNKVTALREKQILNEFSQAIFLQPNSHVLRAETDRYIFYQYDEEIEDQIVWVEVKGETLKAQ